MIVAVFLRLVNGERVSCRDVDKGGKVDFVSDCISFFLLSSDVFERIGPIISLQNASHGS